MVFLNINKALYVNKVMEFINVVKFFDGPYLFTSLTNYDTEEITIRSPKKFH